MNFFKSIFRVMILMHTVSVACSQDWPQYLGPNRNSITDQKGLMRTWPAEGPKILWTASVGIGYGGPVIKDGKVYILDRDDATGDKLRCLDLSNGTELWKFEYEAPGAVMFPGSRSVPVIEGDYVYSCGPFGDLYCIDINSHKPVWNHNIWTDFGGTPGGGSDGGFGDAEAGSFPIWAITQCPLVYGDLLIVASQAPEAGVVAYNKRTGEVKWKTPSFGDVGYVSPSIVKIDGNDHVVMVTPSTNPFRRSGSDEIKLGKIIGIEPLSGKVLWQYDKWNCHIPVPSAVDAGANRILVAGGYELGAMMIKVEKNADGSYIATELFRTEEFGDQTKTPLLYRDHFYAQYGTNNKRDGLVCMNMKGEIMWKTKRDPDFNKGSMVLADGLILATDGAKKLYLIEPDPTGFKALASADLLVEGGTDDSNALATRVGGPTQNWAPIALSKGNLLIRDQSRILCVKVAE